MAAICNLQAVAIQPLATNRGVKDYGEASFLVQSETVRLAIDAVGGVAPHHHSRAGARGAG
eukprot:6502658-Pyramimonas_sp.AAC.1